MNDIFIFISILLSWLFIRLVIHLFGLIKLGRIHKSLNCLTCLKDEDLRLVCPFYRILFSKQLNYREDKIIKKLSEENLRLLKNCLSLRPSILARLKELNDDLENDLVKL